MQNWNEHEVWEAISIISSMRAKFSLFKKKQAPKYHACSMAIRALREVIRQPVTMDNISDKTLLYELKERGYDVSNLINALCKNEN